MDPRVPFSELFGRKFDGRTNTDIAATLGVSLPTIAHWKERGIPACKVPSLPAVKRRNKPREIDRSAMWRTYAMCCEYKQGKTLKQIGQEYGLTHERIRQIIRKAGVTSGDGGVSVRSTNRQFLAIHDKKAVKDSKIAKAETLFGCSFDTIIEINGGPFVWTKSGYGSPARQFVNQKLTAAQRGIGWELTLPEWWSIWQTSGKYDQRGPGAGYCMTRVGNTGPFAKGNVEIKTVGQNFSESYYKHPWHERFKGIHPIGKQAHCKRGHLRSPETCSPCGNCRICAAIRYANRKIAKLARAA